MIFLTMNKNSRQINISTPKARSIKYVIVLLITLIFLSAIPFTAQAQENQSGNIFQRYWQEFSVKDALISSVPILGTSYQATGLVKKGIEKATGEEISVFGLAMNIIDQFLLLVGQLFLTMASWILWAAGTLLNMSISVGIKTMGATIEKTSAIKNAWEIFRDLINITFIFSLLYVAINTIVSGLKDDSKRILRNIIIAALLINFSYFFTSILIDASNILTLEVYDSMTNCNLDEGDPGFISKADNGLSTCFMNALGLQTFFNPGTETSSFWNSISVRADFGMVGAMFLGAIFILVAAVVFFAAAIMIISRFIVLIFLLITSPAMFLGLIIPKMKGVSGGWYKKLTEALISLPVLFIFLLVTYKITEETDIVASGGAFSGIFEGAQSSLAIFINFVIIIGFLIASMVIAKKTGAVGAESSVNFATNTLGGLGRRSFGRVGNWVANNQKLKDASENSALARFARRAGFKAAKGSWDIRAGADKIPGVAAAMKASGFNFGKEQKGGFSQMVDDKEKKLRADAEMLGLDKKKASDDERAAAKKTIDSGDKFFTNEKDANAFKKIAEALESSAKELSQSESGLSNAQSRVATAKAGGDELEILQAIRDLEKTQKRLDVAESNRDKAQLAADIKDENSEASKLVNKQIKLNTYSKVYGGPVRNVAGRFPGLGIRFNAQKKLQDSVRKEMEKPSDEQSLEKLLKGLKDQSKSESEKEKS